MSSELWTAVDQYICDKIVPSDEALDHALRTSDEGGLPPISVTANQGRFLQFLAKIAGAKSILEIGTLGGYSTIWLARTLPDGGKLITLEIDSKHADVARANFEFAGLSSKIELRVGKAIDSLPKLQEESSAPFDLIFIDADKESNPEYFDWAVRLSHPGSIIIVDNVVRNGSIIDEGSDDPRVAGVRRLYDALATDRRVSVTALQTVGSKGYDGFAIALVL